jgi:hypothetical protein
MKERVLILKHSRENPNVIINSNSEFYGACRHKSRFHRYATTTSSPVLMTDESPERVEYNHNSPRNTDTNNRTYVLEEQFAAMEINPLAHISEQQELQENIQVDV